MGKVVWTEESVNWLERIKIYVSQNSTIASDKLIKNIINESLILEKFPNIGLLYKKLSEREVRILIYGHYKIAYWIKDEFVEILGVFHDKMIIDNYL